MQCIICRFEVEPDDAVVTAAGGRVICLRCWNRETGNDPHPMPKKLRHEVEADLDRLARESKWGIG